MIFIFPVFTSRSSYLYILRLRFTWESTPSISNCSGRIIYITKSKKLGPPLRAAAAAAAVATTITLKHFATDKLGEFADNVLVFSRSKREVEKCLVVDRFHEQLHNREEVNA